jgi:hypothetical protein
MPAYITRKGGITMTKLEYKVVSVKRDVVYNRCDADASNIEKQLNELATNGSWRLCHVAPIQVQGDTYHVFLIMEREAK